MFRRQHLPAIAFAAAVLVGGALFAFDGDPADSWHRRIPYTGFLEQSGSPVTGAVEFTTELWGTAAGGAAPIWSEVFIAVPVNSGSFSIILGDDAANAIPASAFDARDGLYLQIVIDGAAIGARQRVLGAPFATGSGGVPPGAIMAFGGSLANLPAGWLPCNGSVVERAVYPALFAAVGSTHGSGNGTTTFALPDYRGRFLRGVDQGAGRDPNRGARSAPSAGGNGGDNVGSVQGDATSAPNSPFGTNATGNHNHNNGSFSRLMVLGSESSSCGRSFASGDVTCSEPDLARSAEIQARGNHSHSVVGGDAETRPQNANVNWIIKY